MAINKVILTGRIVADAELKASHAGTDVLEFRIAVNERRPNRETGEWEDFASFFNCVMFGKRATGIKPFMLKGRPVTVEGHLRQNSWTTEDGQHRSSIKIIVDEVVWDASPASAGDPDAVPFDMDDPESHVHVRSVPEVYDEDIPF